jgi:UDP-sulfoquinovose synthase
MFTRFDSDSAFGTACNKFCLQAVLDQPLTVYGKGEHNRGFLTINDSIQALMIAIKNDNKKEFNVPNGFRPRV